MTDGQLLNEYCESASAAAFAELVRRYINVVYGAALRQVRDAHLAEDVTQATFIVLAQKASSLRNRDVLAGWLLTIVRCAARDALRKQVRRRKHELAAAEAEVAMHDNDADADWERVRPVIDEAMSKLSEDARSAVVLRFFQGKTFPEIGTAFGISEEAARKRVDRAVNMLRRLLKDRGAAFSAAAIGTMLEAHGACAAPAHLVESASAVHGAASTAAGLIAKEVVMSLVWVKLKAAMAAYVVLIPILMIGVVATTNSSGDSAQQPASSPTTQPAKAIPAWYLLRQTNSHGVLEGLYGRLANAIASNEVLDVAQEDSETPSLFLDIRVEEGVEGEIVAGFFADPRWAAAKPIKTLKFPGPGRYAISNLPPGQISIGAMVPSASPNQDDPFGVDESWPKPILIGEANVPQVTLLVSSEFDGHGSSYRDEPYRKWDGKDRPVLVRIMDENDKPLPFCRVIFVERYKDEPSKSKDGHEAMTDVNGYAEADFSGPYTFLVSRCDTLLHSWMLRGSDYEFEKIHQPFDRPVVSIGGIEDGDARLTGRVVDQHGQPLREFWIMLNKFVPSTPFERLTYFCKVPVVNDEGYFEVRGLAPGNYKASVYSFDIEEYAGPQDVRFEIPDQPGAVVDLPLQAIERTRYYGQAFYEDGAPVVPGSASILVRMDSPNFGLGRGERIKPDGSFRICLTADEYVAALDLAKGMVKVYVDGEEIGKFAVDTLSSNPEKPTRLVFKRPAK